MVTNVLGQPISPIFKGHGVQEEIFRKEQRLECARTRHYKTGMTNLPWTSYQTFVCDEGMQMIHVDWSCAVYKPNLVPLNVSANKMSIKHSP